ncbi:unnamed protein product [Nesidiocoris tenuis]|uniref:Uncharacterized protein n=1 Tax=Nesidiocoris tenuis TaxID=355587 RepID=A0A6H5GRZ1_9HEMI|nr:unnamed protein product [Nesidiocoris tenuis]
MRRFVTALSCPGTRFPTSSFFSMSFRCYQIPRHTDSAAYRSKAYLSVWHLTGQRRDRHGWTRPPTAQTAGLYYRIFRGGRDRVVGHRWLSRHTPSALPSLLELFYFK